MKMRREGIIVLALAALAAGCTEPEAPTSGSPAGDTPAPVQPPAPAAPESPDPQTSATEAGPGHYTSLAPEDCQLRSVDKEAGGSTMHCHGMGGFELLVHDSDARMTIDVIAPDNTHYPLKLSSVVGQGAFSSLGPRAEWRFGRDGEAVAMIVRFNVYMEPELPDRPTSYLVVTRLAGGSTCPVAAVAAGQGQNVEARRLADDVGNRACLPEPGA